MSGSAIELIEAFATEKKMVTHITSRAGVVRVVFNGGSDIGPFFMGGGAVSNHRAGFGNR
jgi:hypothetical protein